MDKLEIKHVGAGCSSKRNGAACKVKMRLIEPDFSLIGALKLIREENGK